MVLRGRLCRGSHRHTDTHMWPLEHREHVPHQTKVSVKKVPMTAHVHMQASGIKCFVCQFTLDMVMH